MVENTISQATPIVKNTDDIRFLSARAGFPADVLIQGLLHGVEGFDIAQLPHDGRLAGEAHDQQGKGIAGEKVGLFFSRGFIGAGHDPERQPKIGLTK